MYEELVKRLREAPNDWPDADLHYESADAIEELQAQINGWIEQERKSLLKSVPRWISVEERLPDEWEPVYAAVRSEGREDLVIEVEAYDPYLACPWGHIPMLESGKATVYAWMPRPLPEPPKEDETDEN